MTTARIVAAALVTAAAAVIAVRIADQRGYDRGFLNGIVAHVDVILHQSDET